MKSIRNSWWAVLALAASFVGCDNPAPAPSTAPAQGTAPAAAPAKVEDKKADEKKVDIKQVKLTDEQLAEIKKLPEADQKIALEQKVCPIGGDNLGDMGVPVKVMLKDQAVFLCCGGCEKKAKADPEATLAKLGKK
jgi:hypothetical protein